MSDMTTTTQGTPRTDAAIWTTREFNQTRRGLCANEYDAGELKYVSVDFARTLERELSQALARVAELEGALRDCCDAIEEEVLASGNEDHPVIHRHERIAESGRRLLARAALKGKS